MNILNLDTPLQSTGDCATAINKMVATFPFLTKNAEIFFSAIEVLNQSEDFNEIMFHLRDVIRYIPKPVGQSPIDILVIPYNLQEIKDDIQDFIKDSWDYFASCEVIVESNSDYWSKS